MNLPSLPSKDALMSQLTAAKQRAAEERLLPAVPLQYTHPMVLSMQLFMQRHSWQEKLADKSQVERQIRQTFLGQETNFSSTPLHKLKPILLKDMEIRQLHKGRYLLCRVIAPPNRMIATALGVEDTAGWAQLVSLYNYPGTYSAGPAELDALFPLNSVLAIREPCLKMALAASHSHIRVDSPTDLVMLEPGSPLLKAIHWTTGVRPLPVLTKTANEWKEVGDKHFKAKEFYGAIASYSFALQRNPSLISVNLNRSLASLRIGRNKQAIEDARAVLTDEQLPSTDRVKALYRCAQGMYAEEKYAGAKKWYSKCLSIDPTLADAMAGVQRTECRIKEQTSSSYNWADLFEQHARNPSFRPDMANFQGPVEKRVMSHRGGGRGIVATRDIVAGELLVVSKPFASGDPTIDGNGGIFFALDFLTNSMQKESQYILIHNAISKATWNPGDAETILDLYGGVKHQSPPRPVVKSSSGTIPNPSYDIDSSKIEAICMLNSFGAPGGKGKKGTGNTDEDTSTVLYILPSYFNHSCLPNANRCNIGHVMIIRAAMHVKKGEEITLSYRPLDMDYEERERTLKKWFPQCDCSLCSDDRDCGASKRQERRELSERLKNPALTIDQRRAITKKLDSTYSSGYGWFRPDSAMAHQTLARGLETMALRKAQNNFTNLQAVQLFKESIQEDFKSLEACGVEVLDRKTNMVRDTQDISLPISVARVPDDSTLCVSLCLHTVARFSMMNNLKRAEMWMRAALWIESAWKGDGIETFKRQWSVLLKDMGEHAYALLDKIALSNATGRHGESSGGVGR